MSLRSPYDFMKSRAAQVTTRYSDTVCVFCGEEVKAMMILISEVVLVLARELGELRGLDRCKFCR